MPEVAEVRRIVDQMSEVILNQTLESIQILSGRYLKSKPENYIDFTNALQMRITNLNCKGKFIYFETDSVWNIWNTLGLTGGWTKDSENEHNRLKFNFANIDPVYFYDIRNFGTIKFCKSEAALLKKIKSLGPDILQEVIPDNVFKSLLRAKGKKTLPEVLMDQSVLAGVGNYIKAESLYLAKISPHRLASSLTDDEYSLLNQAIHSVATESYKSGGSTFRSYADFNGEGGSFASRFMVYGQSKDPKGNVVVREETKDKRTTFWVPNVQK